jgi:hypothetical protein
MERSVWLFRTGKKPSRAAASAAGEAMNATYSATSREARPQQQRDEARKRAAAAADARAHGRPPPSFASSAPAAPAAAASAPPAGSAAAAAVAAAIAAERWDDVRRLVEPFCDRLSCFMPLFCRPAMTCAISVPLSAVRPTGVGVPRLPSPATGRSGPTGLLRRLLARYGTGFRQPPAPTAGGAADPPRAGLAREAAIAPEQHAGHGRTLRRRRRARAGARRRGCLWVSVLTPYITAHTVGRRRAGAPERRDPPEPRDARGPGVRPGARTARRWRLPRPLSREIVYRFI